MKALRPPFRHRCPRWGESSGRAALLALALLLLFDLAAPARVFTRWSGRSNLATTFTSLGGHLVYESRIRLNGGEGDLQVFDLEQPLAQVAAALRERLAAEEFADCRGSLACVTLQDESQVLRLVIAQLDPSGHTVAFALRQTPEAFAASSGTAAVPALEGLPAHPAATPSFCAEDLKTATRFGLSAIAIPVTDAQAYYNAAFTGAGWQSLTPASSGSAALHVYSRDRELCFVLAASAPDAEGATITLLHKRLGLE